MTTSMARKIWIGPTWALAVLLSSLSMLGPFAVDTYIPAFAPMMADLSASPVQLQQTLSVYLVGFAVMNLFHGAISDSLGRRRVVLWGLVVFSLASLGCANARSIELLIFFRALQGMATGAGIVVGRAILRDILAPEDAQRAMNQVTIFFGIAPALAPMLGGLISEYFGWRVIFLFLAGLGLMLWALNYRFLPESLQRPQRQPFSMSNLLSGYGALFTDRRVALLSLSSGLPFTSMFLYILAAPAFLGEHLQWPTTDFFLFFLLTISGVMVGAWANGFAAGKLSRGKQIGIGFSLMFLGAALNVGFNLYGTMQLSLLLFPIWLLSFGWAQTVPLLTIMLLDLHPNRRGMASSAQSFVGSIANAVAAGVVAPVAMGSVLGLATASTALLLCGLLTWMMVRRCIV